jgi:hypothetical protein
MSIPGSFVNTPDRHPLNFIAQKTAPADGAPLHGIDAARREGLERAMGIEPTTFSLGSQISIWKKSLRFKNL